MPDVRENRRSSLVPRRSWSLRDNSGRGQRATSYERRLLCLLLLLIALPCYARDWRIADFRSSITLDEHGNAQVQERITAVFHGQYNGIYRSIPVEYPGPHGTNYSLFVHVTGVEDDSGHPLKHEITREGAYKKIKIYLPGAEDATRTVLIDYSIPNAVRYFQNYDEFYWNVTGNDTTVPTDAASAVVNFPAAAANNLRAQAFTGVYGATGRDADVQINGAGVTVQSRNPLEMHEGLTVDIAMNKGILHEPSSLTYAAWFVRSNPALLIPLWTFLVMFTMWYRFGRDPDSGLSVAPMYEPPKQMRPAEAGTLIDDSVDPRDITSTIVDLAVRGYLKIEEQETGTIFHTQEYVFHRITPGPGDDKLDPFESVMINNIFATGNDVPLHTLRNRFYTALPTIKHDLYAALRSKGMYLLDPESAAGYVVVGGLISAAPFVAVQVMGVASLFDEPLVPILSIGVAVVILILFGRQMPAKTLQGARTRVAVLGFQEFMNRVDADRLKTLQLTPEHFEKYLPYAMALGVEHHWAQAFTGMLTQNPSWYVGPYGTSFNPVYFSSSMSHMASVAGQTFASAPRSSSGGSGFGGGGGGFSGGGFGGGGTGAF